MPEFHSIGALLVGAYFFLLTAFSGIPFSPFSREGKMNIWFLRSQPVSGRTAAKGKALAAEIMIVAGAIPGLAVLQYIARLPMASLIIGVSLGIASSYALCIWGVLLDMARPMLDWTDQQKAIKSNLNTIIGILIGMVVLFLMGYLVYILFQKGYSGLVAQVISGAVITLVLASGLRALRAVGDKLWSSIEL
jgi:ABC-2 type transport system permease protein